MDTVTAATAAEARITVTATEAAAEAVHTDIRTAAMAADRSNLTLAADMVAAVAAADVAAGALAVIERPVASIERSSGFERVRFLDYLLPDCQTAMLQSLACDCIPPRVQRRMSNSGSRVSR